MSLFSEPVLVVRQKPEIVESTALYAISDQNGASMGSVTSVGMRDLGTALRPGQLARQATPGADNRPTGVAGASKAAFDAVRSVVRQMPYRLEVRNDAGAAVLMLTSGEWGFFDWDQRSLITVSRGDGETIGTIALEEVGWLPRKPLFALEAGGHRVGTIVADEWYTVGHRVSRRAGKRGRPDRSGGPGMAVSDPLPRAPELRGPDRPACSRSPAQPAARRRPHGGHRIEAA